MKVREWIKNLFSRSKASQTSSVILSGQYGTIWPERNYENFANEAYVKNVIAFKAIEEVAKSVATAPWGLYRKDENGNRIRVDNHPILDLINRPNPQESFTFLIMKAIAFLLISGNSYFEKIGPLTGAKKGIPKELYAHRPDRMRIEANPETGMIIYYEYEVNGRSVTWDVDPITGKCDILHLKTFHPTDDWYGLAVTEPAARNIDINNAATEWNKKLIENECRPGMIYTVVGNLGDKQYERMEKQLKEKFSGYSNSGRSLIIEGESGTKAEPYSWSPAEMDFIEGNRETARRIAYAYGVPSMLIGIPGDNTYSNYKEARLAFWEDTVIYYLKLLKAEFNNWLFDSNEFYLDYDLDDIPALEPRREAKWEKAQKSDFLDFNEKRELVGFEKKVGGDVILVPATMIPLETAVMPPEDDEVVEEDDEEAIEKLVEKGYTKEQAEEIIGRND